MLLFELELFLLFLEMPPKRKRKLEERLQKGRDVKRTRQGNLVQQGVGKIGELMSLEASLVNP